MAAGQAPLPVFGAPGPEYNQLDESQFRRSVERFMQEVAQFASDSSSIAAHNTTHYGGGTDPLLISDLGETAISSPSAGNYLRWNGSDWANVAASQIVTDINALLDHGTLLGLADDDHTQYHTDARALTWLGTRSTTDLPEGTNLYYTNARADARIALASIADLATKDHDLLDGLADDDHTQYYNQARGDVRYWRLTSANSATISNAVNDARYLLVGDASRGWQQLVPGAALQGLRINALGTALEWATLSGGDVSTGSGDVANRVAVWSASNTISGYSDFVFTDGSPSKLALTGWMEIFETSSDVALSLGLASTVDHWIEMGGDTAYMGWKASDGIVIKNTNASFTAMELWSDGALQLLSRTGAGKLGKLILYNSTDYYVGVETGELRHSGGNSGNFTSWGFETASVFTERMKLDYDVALILNDGIRFRAYDSGNTKYVNMWHDGTDGNLAASSGDLKIGAPGLNVYPAVDGTYAFGSTAAAWLRGFFRFLRPDSGNDMVLEDDGGTDVLKITTAAYAEFVRQAYCTIYDKGAISANWTINWAQGNSQFVNISGSGAYTVSFTNNQPGSILTLTLRNGSGGALGTHTWDSEIIWEGGTAPTLPGNGDAIVVMFKCLSATETLGWWSGDFTSVSDI
jgi:hypothetical protein